MRLRAQNSDIPKVELKKLNRQLRPLIAVLVVMVLSLLVMLGALSLPHLFPWMMERMGERGALQGASSVRRMLECCRVWYMLLLGTGGAIVLALAVCLIFEVRGIFRAILRFLSNHRHMKRLEPLWLQESMDTLHELLEPEEMDRLVHEVERSSPSREADPWERPDAPPEPEAPAETAGQAYRRLSSECAAQLTAVLLLLCGIPLIVLMTLFPVLMLRETEGLQLYAQVTEDIQMLDAGQVDTFTVWLSPKARQVTTPGPWSESYPTPLTRYGAIGEDTGGEWIKIYVLPDMDFSLDPDALYNENKSILWNQEHAMQYQVSCTRNFCFVTGIRPLGLPYFSEEATNQ